MKAASFPCLPRCLSPALPDSLLEDIACLGQTTEYLTVRGWEAQALAEAECKPGYPWDFLRVGRRGRRGPASESRVPPPNQDYVSQRNREREYKLPIAQRA